MKYPSVLLVILVAWVCGIAVTYFVGNKSVVSMYSSLVVFTLAMFLIGFWRNK